MPTPPAPFDAVANQYDTAFTHTAVGRLQRAVVQHFLSIRLGDAAPGQALELNCGTGIDACWLAHQGWEVLATDVSSGMLALAQENAAQAGLEGRIRTAVLDLSHPLLPQMPERRQQFDLVFSNFGGLNCVSPETLPQLGEALPLLLKPGGLFVAVVMGRFCCWEMLYFLIKGRPKEAFRRLSKEPLEARLDQNTSVKTWYFSPKEFIKILSFNNLTKKNIQAVGFWAPPSYLNSFFEKRPRLLRFLYFLEKNCRGKTWAFGADHFLVCWQKTQNETA